MPVLNRNSFLFQFLVLLAMFWQPPANADALSAEAAYQKGKILHFQDKFEEAEPYLLQAGEQGYPAAYFLIASSGHINRFFMSNKEYRFKKLAAENGHLISMISLTMERSSSPNKSYWKEHLLKILEPHIENRNPLAIQLKNYATPYTANEEIYYLKKAAYPGYPKAQLKLARRYESGEGWFFLPGSREKEVERLYNAAARGGYHDAIWNNGINAIQEGEVDKGLELLNPLFEKGDASKMYTFGTLTAGISAAGPNWPYIDKLLGTTYTNIVASSMSETHEDMYSFMNGEAKAELTEKENQQVEKMTEEYLKTHTVYKQDGLDEYEYTVDNLHTALERWGGNAIE
ncbi:hypothetical protein LRP49_07795 [Enterovibrio sp. ZSDZ35]|uniref:Sel1 repeat family protein n=1 Tax=Enterovibrio qingdaonensis TaxID=2899818 RepID=A0ABT5QJE4_9GAMM|nr:hypothetical protein [Enterovibrio sp. ZSDZ35]MDD1781105.1 hypothetical protein [Enterovibrio sp. ZSDZ35]